MERDMSNRALIFLLPVVLMACGGVTPTCPDTGVGCPEGEVRCYTDTDAEECEAVTIMAGTDCELTGYCKPEE